MSHASPSGFKPNSNELTELPSFLECNQHVFHFEIRREKWENPLSTTYPDT